MMMLTRNILVALAAGLFVVACGSGGGDSLAGGGIGGTGITATGAITGFGSIKLNGFELETGGAIREVDGVVDISDGTDDATVLGVGMVVTVTGALNDDGVTGVATRIVYDDAVQGPILGPIVAVDQTKRFTVMGIPVSVSRLGTVFANTDFVTLAVDDWVELSGFFDVDGVLHATRLEIKGGGELEVKGVVGPFGVRTFQLTVTNGATYTVDYSNVSLPSLLTIGDLVEVKGSLSGNTILATEVEREDGGLDDVEKASIEGIVTGFAAGGLSSFQVAGQQVNASGTEVSFEPATLASTIGDGMQVEVEGPIVNGVLQATRVESRAGDIRLAATLASVAPDAGGATGSITLGFAVGNLTLLVDSQTALRDDTDAVDQLSLNDLTPGLDYIEAEAYLGDAGTLVATEIRRDDVDDDQLQGSVDSCAAGVVTILGLGFSLVDGVTSYQDEDEDGAAINSAVDFCASQTSSGFDVRVVDTNDSGQLPDGIADEAELEH